MKERVEVKVKAQLSAAGAGGRACLLPASSCRSPLPCCESECGAQGQSRLQSLGGHNGSRQEAANGIPSWDPFAGPVAGGWLALQDPRDTAKGLRDVFESQCPQLAR